MLTVMFAFILVASLLAACGGDDSDDSGSTDPPVPDGADQIAEADMDPDDFGETDVELAEGKTVAYRVSDSSFDEVSEFYQTGVEDDGWTVVNHVAISGVMLSVMSKDMTIIIASAMTGATAKDQSETFGLEELDIQDDELADDDILVVVGDLDCEGDNLDVCIEALNLGF